MPKNSKSDPWSKVNPHFLIRETSEFIVWIDESLNVDWESTPGCEVKIKRSPKITEVLSRASTLEAADWGHSDKQKTHQFKRLIAQAIADSLAGNVPAAEAALNKAEEYRVQTLARREAAIQEQIELKNDWKREHIRWITTHYAVGIGALLASALVAAGPSLGIEQLCVPKTLSALFS